MLRREINWVLRDGELETDTSTSYSWVGGSPVTINSSGKVSGNLGTTAKAQANSFVAVAWHSQEYDKDNGKSTIIFPPAKLKLEKGTETSPTGGKSYTDAVAPWKTGLTYAVGDLLRPTVTSGTPAYAVWTNEAYPNEVTNTQYTYQAKVIEIEGSGSNPTSLTILLEPVYKQA